MTEAEAFVASIRTRVGQIKKAQRTPTADAWGQIEIACDKLLQSAGSFERSIINPGFDQVFEFLNSIEGSGYGGMAEFEIARETMRRASTLSPSHSETP